jgi:microcompartment protein CcmK/EutM
LRLGRVIGALWGARQAPGVSGQKLLKIDLADAVVVAVDGLAAGPGDLVLVAHGSRVRDLTVGETVADKDVVVAIVDGTSGGPRP